ncbi:MAG: nucleotidyl transferase AbiEii/AbiGii toxin family protein [Anaerolineaceae bacterium]|nr:nucleotidyl transferase AbiEii/AbiGii toxin family protein [Anaerolineaceae bacterium]
MLKIAKADRQERTEIFQIVSKEMGVPAVIVEKDFWVCYVLDYLFNRSEFKNHLIFKGGTSLSKCYALINRFSEDIDLILDWREIGYSIDEPWNERSNSKQERFKLETIERTNSYLLEKFVPTVIADLSNELGYELKIYPAREEETVIIAYPKEFESSATLDVIRLEIGPLAEWDSPDCVNIHSYLAEFRPGLFKNPQFSVKTVKPERSFWEKATILHQEANRPGSKLMPLRYSRHYYDMYQLGNSFVKRTALDNMSLLAKVVAFKEKFYRVPWSKLSEATPGTFRLVPPEYRMKELMSDYLSMEQMLIGNFPSLNQVIHYLNELEAEINQFRA